MAWDTKCGSPLAIFCIPTHFMAAPPPPPPPCHILSGATRSPPPPPYFVWRYTGAIFGLFGDIFTLNADYIAWKLLKMALEDEYVPGRFETAKLFTWPF